MVQQYIQPDPPASKPRPPTPRKNKPKSAKDEKWIGGGPAPAEGSRVIQILYLLSEEGQREAFLSTKSMPVAIDRTALRMPQYWSWWLESQMRFEI